MIIVNMIDKNEKEHRFKFGEQFLISFRRHLLHFIDEHKGKFPTGILMNEISYRSLDWYCKQIETMNLKKENPHRLLVQDLLGLDIYIWDEMNTGMAYFLSGVKKLKPIPQGRRR